MKMTVKQEMVVELLKILNNETMESMCKRGRGTTLEQWCIWAKLSEYGTAKEKAQRLLGWRKQNEK